MYGAQYLNRIPFIQSNPSTYSLQRDIRPRRHYLLTSLKVTKVGAKRFCIQMSFHFKDRPKVARANKIPSFPILLNKGLKLELNIKRMNQTMYKLRWEGISSLNLPLSKKLRRKKRKAKVKDYEYEYRIWIRIIIVIRCLAK